MEPSVPDHFERMWARPEPVGRSARRRAATSASRSPPPSASWPRGSSSRPPPAGCGSRPTRSATWSRGGTSVVRDERSIPGSDNIVTDYPAGVVTGSHLDSVLDGGAYDGPLGVVSALAAVDLLRERGFRPARPIGVSVFVEEEGSRFGLACLGLAAGDRRDHVVAGPRAARPGRRTARGGDGCGRARGRGSPALVGLLAHRVLRGAPRRAGARPGRPRPRRSASRAGSGRTGATGSTSPASPTTRARPGWRTGGTRC